MFTSTIQQQLSSAGILLNIGSHWSGSTARSGPSTEGSISDTSGWSFGANLLRFGKTGGQKTTGVKLARRVGTARDQVCSTTTGVMKKQTLLGVVCSYRLGFAFLFRLSIRSPSKQAAAATLLFEDNFTGSIPRWTAMQPT